MAEDADQVEELRAEVESLRADVRTLTAALEELTTHQAALAEAIGMVAGASREAVAGILRAAGATPPRRPTPPMEH